MDGRQEAVRRYDHEAGCTGPCGDGDYQSLQHVSREGDRLYRERTEQEGAGGSEKGRALRGSLADARPDGKRGRAPVQPKSAPSPAAASSSETFSSSFFSSFFFSSFFSAAGAAAGAAAGIATAAFRASSMFTPSSAAVRAFTRVSSTFTPAAVRTFFRLSSFTGLPAACRTSAP